MDKKLVSVDHLARLANLKINPQEKKTIGPQLEATLNHFAILDQVTNLNQESPTFQVTDNINLVAEDKIEPCLPRKKILPSAQKYFVAKK